MKQPLNGSKENMVNVKKKLINTFDIDGVIFMDGFDGVYPGPDDIIITGRSFQEEIETLAMLESKGINNKIFMNPRHFSKKTRESSGKHKANIISKLKSRYRIGCHYEDDPIQAKEITDVHPDVHVILLVHDLVEKENMRHL